MAGFVLFLAVISSYLPENSKFNTNLKLYIDAFIRDGLEYSHFTRLFTLFFLHYRKKMNIKKIIKTEFCKFCNYL